MGICETGNGHPIVCCGKKENGGLAGSFQKVISSLHDIEFQGTSKLRVKTGIIDWLVERAKIPSLDIIR